MLKTLASVCLAAGFTAVLAFPQGRGTPPDPQTMIQRRVDFLASQLNLTDAQKTSALTIFTNAFTASQSIQSSLQTNRESLDAAVKKNDTAAIDSLSITAGSLSGQLTAIHSKAEAAFYALLTADQRTKFDSLPHGPGGFGGPGAMGRFRSPQRP